LPILEGDSISDFWGTARDDVWAVGCCSGGIYHWDGDSWQRLYTASEPYVTHVGGSARDDVWFTLRPSYQTTIVLHWDGKSFSEVASFDRSAWAITATNPNDVWLALNGEVGHYDGVSWTVEPTSATRALAVRGAGVFFTGNNRHIYQNR
jgi:hypothetical protein